MTQTLTIVGRASFPLEDDPAVAAQIDLALTMGLSQIMSEKLVYDALVTDQAVGLGTLSTGGAKVLIVKCPVGGCTIKLNASTDAIPVAAGLGYICIANPSQGWLTALKISTTGPATVRVVALG